MGVGEGELCGWAAVRNAMVDKHRVTEILIDQPTGRRGRWRGQTGGVGQQQAGLDATLSARLSLLLCPSNAVRLQTINDTFLIPAIALVLLMFIGLVVYPFRRQVLHIPSVIGQMPKSWSTAIYNPVVSHSPGQR